MPSRRGIWVFVLMLGVMGLVVLLAAMQLRGPATSNPDSTVLVFDVPVALEETPPPFPAIPAGWVRRSKGTVEALVDGLDHAAHDDRVSALVLHVGNVDWGWAKIAELRDAVLRFRSSGKPVYASVTGGGEAGYLLATAADAISIPPASVLQLDGLSASAIFMRGSFDKLDIRPNFAHSGRFKSGVETYTRTGMSPEAREALEALLDDGYRLLADSIGAARGMSAESVQRLMDEGPFSAADALEHGLVDTLLHEVDLDSLALLEAGQDAGPFTLWRYVERLPSARLGTRVALIAASGMILPGRSRYVAGEGQVVGAETLIESLRQIRTRRAIKAVVLRIDSPGGELNASDDVWREIRRLGEVKPVVVSMSDYAASGGYYIAVAGGDIVAQPSTVTGSIGIYGGKLNVLGLYRKLGLGVETVSRGRHADMWSPFRDFTPEEAERYQRQLEAGYALFRRRVAEGRGLPAAYVDSIAEGRVWSGIAAYELGLVDTLGGFETAFGIALRRAGYPHDGPYVVERYPKVEHPFLERLVEDWFQETSEAQESAFSPVLRSWLAAARFPVGAALALMPYSIEFH